MPDDGKTAGQRAGFQEMAVPPLTQLYAYLTDGCNLYCRHCWLDPLNGSEKKKYMFLPAGLFEKAVDEAKSLGLQAVKLTGGEPLLHPEFSRFLHVIRTYELDLVLETNGFFCTKETTAEIADIRSRFVSVSIDGCDSETHDWVRRTKGSFDRAKKAVQMLAASGTATQIIMTVMQKNVRQIDSVVELARELGASSVKFNIMQPTARGRQMHSEGESPGIDEIIRLGRYVENELAALAGIDLFYDYPPAFRSLSSISGGDGCSVCGIHGIIGLISDGSYALCGIARHVREFVFGRAGDVPLETVWRESGLLQEIRAGIPERLGGICGRCIMKRICLGSCVAQNYYRRGSLWEPFWFCEEAEEKGLFPRTRMTVLTEKIACTRREAWEK